MWKALQLKQEFEKTCQEKPCGKTMWESPEVFKIFQGTSVGKGERGWSRCCKESLWHPRKHYQRVNVQSCYICCFLMCFSWRWVSLARGEHSCDVCGKGFSNRTHLRNHIELEHEVRFRWSRFVHRIQKLKINIIFLIQCEKSDKSQGHGVVYYSVEVNAQTT